MNTEDVDKIIEAKMRAAGMGAPAIKAFLGAVHQVIAGDTGLLPENTIEPVPSLPRLADFSSTEPEADGLLKQLALVKLNGGLGTSMGLERAKSLLVVKGEN